MLVSALEQLLQELEQGVVVEGVVVGNLVYQDEVEWDRVTYSL